MTGEINVTADRGLFRVLSRSVWTSGENLWGHLIIFCLNWKRRINDLYFFILLERKVFFNIISNSTKVKLFQHKSWKTPLNKQKKPIPNAILVTSRGPKSHWLVIASPTILRLSITKNIRRRPSVFSFFYFCLKKLLRIQEGHAPWRDGLVKSVPGKAKMYLFYFLCFFFFLFPPPFLPTQSLLWAP